MRRPNDPRPAWLLVALACLAPLGCSGKGPDNSGGVTPPPPTPASFQCSDSSVSLNKVALKCAAQVKSDVWQIDVVIGSPTDSTDINGFAFDLLFDPAYVEYVPDSARVGSMLTQYGDTPLLSVGTVAGDPGRLVVGISRTSGFGGVQGLPNFDQIMVFRVHAVAGVVFDPSPMYLRFDPDKFQALDSSAQAQSISSITFSDQLLLSRQ